MIKIPTACLKTSVSLCGDQRLWPAVVNDTSFSSLGLLRQIFLILHDNNLHILYAFVAFFNYFKLDLISVSWGSGKSEMASWSIGSVSLIMT